MRAHLDLGKRQMTMGAMPKGTEVQLDKYEADSARRTR